MIRRAALLLLVVGCNAPDKQPAHPPIDPASVVQYGPDMFSEGFDGGVQGSTGSNWWVNEMPSHAVTLSAFTLDLHEVTTLQYATFLRQAGGVGHYSSHMPIVLGPTSQDFVALPSTEQVAVHDVTWFDARAYCLWLGGDLPTEAQWEYAAKGADVGRIYPWGTTSPSCDTANLFTGDVSCEMGPVAVGSYDAGLSPEGAEDLGGNVAEWVLDAYDAYTSDPQTDPSGPTAPMYGVDAATVLRVVRGGGFHDIPLSLRTTNRWGADAALRSKGVGFRCAYP